jgi:hypothetical protein
VFPGEAGELAVPVIESETGRSRGQLFQVGQPAVGDQRLGEADFIGVEPNRDESSLCDAGLASRGFQRRTLAERLWDGYSR